MSQKFNVVVERDSEGYFVASVPSLPGCHTQAKSVDELLFHLMAFENSIMTKRNFEQMTRGELLTYLKEHRDDNEAWGIYALDCRNPNATKYPPPLDDEGIRIMEEAFRQKLQEISAKQPPTN